MGGPPNWTPYSYWDFLPFVFIHYAEDTSSLDSTIRRIEYERDKKLVELAIKPSKVCTTCAAGSAGSVWPRFSASWWAAFC